MILKISGTVETIEDEREKDNTIILDRVVEVRKRPVTPREAAFDSPSPVHYTVSYLGDHDEGTLVHLTVVFEPGVHDQAFETYIALAGCSFLMNDRGDTIERL